MRHLFSWVLLVMLCSLGISQLHYIKELRLAQKHIETLRNKPTIINVPVFDGEQEKVQSFLAFGVASTGGDMPGVIPIFISEDEYANWKNKVRLQYVKYMEEQKEKANATTYNETGDESGTDGSDPTDSSPDSVS